MENIKKFWNSFDSAVQKGLCIALSIIMLFSAGYLSGTLSTASKTSEAPETTQQSAQVDATVTTTTQAPVTTTTTAAPDTTVAPPVENNTSAAQTTTASSSAAPATKDEIVALFNEAANKVKTDAVKATKNFENRRYDAAQSVIPSALNALADSLMAKYLTDDTVPIEYATKDEITANYPVPGQSYSSKLTPADVAEATCTDNGTEYEITLNLATSVNPVEGTGVGAACDVLEASEISSNEMVSSILKDFTVTYSGCVIKCKIDKATNHLTWANYYTPLTIDALASVLISTVEAKVVLSFEKEYTVTY